MPTPGGEQNRRQLEPCSLPTEAPLRDRGGQPLGSPFAISWPVSATADSSLDATPACSNPKLGGRGGKALGVPNPFVFQVTHCKMAYGRLYSHNLPHFKNNPVPLFLHTFCVPKQDSFHVFKTPPPNHPKQAETLGHFLTVWWKSQVQLVALHPCTPLV